MVLLNSRSSGKTSQLRQHLNRDPKEVREGATLIPGGKRIPDTRNSTEAGSELAACLVYPGRASRLGSLECNER